MNRKPAGRCSIIFVILAHEREDILAQQVKNFRFFNPGARIVLYNSSGNPNFGRQIKGLTVCPYSRGPLAWGRTGNVLYDVIRWLNETGADYDFLVYMDSDVMFIRHGFAAFLEKAMQGADFMGFQFRVEHAPTDWIPGKTMWREWETWRSLFQTDFLAGLFANGQVYRRELLQRIYDGIDLSRLEQLFHTTQVVALEEILHPTLAVRCGGRFAAFPKFCDPFVRFWPPLKLKEVKQAARTKSVFFVHPLLRRTRNPARRWVERLSRPRNSKKLTRKRKSTTGRVRSRKVRRQAR